jgi:hypothetical protein
LAAERLDAAPRQKDVIAAIDDAGDDRGLDMLFAKFHRGEFRGQESEFKREAKPDPHTLAEGC